MQRLNGKLGPKRRICLGIPAYGSISWFTFQAAYFGATQETNDGYRWEVDIKPNLDCSLLAFGFNQLWRYCLNSKNPFDYFCLLHADVSPQGYWLDLLIEALETGGYDAIHAPVAIKDERGVTSTGIGPLGDWMPVRKITTTELKRLPEVFDIEDCRRELDVPHDWYLLPNTGCLVIKLGKWCRRFPGFQVRDRMVVRYPSGHAIPCEDFIDDPELPEGAEHDCQVMPEDWNFGRWMAANGKRVAGCRRVSTWHFGSKPFPSEIAWGSWATDPGHQSKVEEVACG